MRGSNTAIAIDVTDTWQELFSAATDGPATGFYINAADNNEADVKVRWKPSKGVTGWSYCTYPPGADLPPIKSDVGIGIIEISGTEADTINASCYSS